MSYVNSGDTPDAASIMSDLNSEASAYSDGDSLNDTREEESGEEDPDPAPMAPSQVKERPPAKKRRRDLVPVEPAFQPSVSLEEPESYSEAIRKRLAGWAAR